MFKSINTKKENKKLILKLIITCTLLTLFTVMFPIMFLVFGIFGGIVISCFKELDQTRYEITDGGFSLGNHRDELLRNLNR